MADLIALCGGIVILASFGKLCVAGYRWVTKRFEVGIDVRRREEREDP